MEYSMFVATRVGKGEDRCSPGREIFESSPIRVCSEEGILLAIVVDMSPSLSFMSLFSLLVPIPPITIAVHALAIHLTSCGLQPQIAIGGCTHLSPRAWKAAVN